MKVLGISAYYHDSAAALVIDGRLVAAAQEERFSRKKHDRNFPSNSVRFCLRHSGIDAEELDAVVFYDKPLLKFQRLVQTQLAFAPRGLRPFLDAQSNWLSDKLFQRRSLRQILERELAASVNWKSRLYFSEHHLSHAASAFYPSPFERSAILTMDGVGEWTTTSLAVGEGRLLRIIKEIHFPHSLGLLYAAFTSYTGFKVNSGEYKVMGLAPYGKPVFADDIKKHLIQIADDGSFRLNMKFFDFCAGTTMTNAAFHELFGGAPRRSESPLSQRHMDLAASIQNVTEEIVVNLARGVAESTGERNLCLAGGVALNCVANGKLLREGVFDKIWIQPAAGDAGGAIGAALGWYHLHAEQPRRTIKPDAMNGSYLGPSYTDSEIEHQLKEAGAVFHRVADSEVIERTVTAMIEGKAVGWFQGRMEFGPRALGSRSIIADARSHDMQKTLNLKVKYRESFRPFAPSVLREDVSSWFEIDEDSPYMLLVADVAKHRRLHPPNASHLEGIALLNQVRSDIPAVTHVDYSARIQTVHAETNPRYHQLISRFKERTGCPVVVNTSFNVRGEPIVESPSDAFRCFMGTEIEVLVIENFVLYKDEQLVDRLRYEGAFDLD
ncbi:MAG: carbamoyltransferase [Ilumatobacteraceae bacterium]